MYEREVRDKQLVSCAWEKMSLYSYVVYFRGTSASCFVSTLFLGHGCCTAEKRKEKKKVLRRRAQKSRHVVNVTEFI